MIRVLRKDNHDVMRVTQLSHTINKRLIILMAGDEEGVQEADISLTTRLKPEHRL